MSWFRQRVIELLAPADIRIGGERPWDIQVNDARFFRRAVLQGSLGLGESYMDGWWDCERLDEMFFRLLRADVDKSVNDWHRVVLSLRTRLFNLQSRTGAFQIGRRHYDLGEELFECMLDPLLIYSCGYWKDADDLAAAQCAKLDLVAKKLGLQAGMRVLDVGCGWGGAVKYLAETHGVEAIGITVSRHQAAFARAQAAGLPVDIRLEDYRDLPDEFPGHFDRAFSIGMFEHVGYRNYRQYFEVLRQCLKPDGLFLLHSIGRNTSSTHTDPWIARYIFPRSNLPSIRQIGGACEGLFVMEDWHNFGADYDRTLLAWHARFETHCTQLPPQYDERFRRMWRLYLLMSAAGFRARRMQLWQLVLSPRGVSGGYVAPR
ncbi:MAG TPA: cyclopropane fatty acyl phospholipid synthase [Gammaproteobacteria bacterium]